MKVKKLASHLAKEESGLVQARIGDKRQDVAALSDLVFKEGIIWRDSMGIPYAVGGSTILNLYLNGERRAGLVKIEKLEKTKSTKRRKKK